MTFQDIFSKTKTGKEEKCPNPKVPIIIDTREKQSLIATNLISKKANTTFEKLDVGDYEIGDSLIERKTFPDFLSSMINKRLQEQLINLKKSKRPMLLIEGFGYNYQKYNIHENAIKGMLLSVAFDFQIPIIYTKDSEDTANFLILLAKKQEKETQKIGLRPTKNLKNFQDQKQFILEGFPGIGPTTAQNLLDEFNNLKSIFNAKKEKFQEASNLSEDKIETFYKILEE